MDPRLTEPTAVVGASHPLPVVAYDAPGLTIAGGIGYAIEEYLCAAFVGAFNLRMVGVSGADCWKVVTCVSTGAGGIATHL